MADIAWVKSRVDTLKRRGQRRMIRAHEVAAIRKGDFDAVAPEMFSSELPRPIVANQVDIIAHHAAAALSPLPLISCTPLNSSSDRARKIGDKRTKIANSYVRRSRLRAQMQTGADQFYTYGLVVASVEACDDGSNMPEIFIEDSSTFYPLWDRSGRTKAIARVFKLHILELLTQFPQFAAQIRQATNRGAQGYDGDVTLVKYEDDKSIVLYMEDPGFLLLIDMANPLGRCSYVATMKPTLDQEIRGSLDDIVWIQLAKNLMQTYMLSAADQAVNAPWSAPLDVSNIEFGPNEVIRSSSPRDIGRVQAEVPQSAWATVEFLGREIDKGAINPEALGGSIDAANVTGKGLQQLMAGYSQQIAMGQDTLLGFYEDIIELCFLTDEKYYGEVTKSIQGKVDGQPYEVTYKPSRDIAGDYSVQVQYGGVAGLQPSQALVFLLQGRGDKLFSRDYVRRHLPNMDLDPASEESKIAVESMRDGLENAIAGLTQAIPQMVAGGQDPTTILLATAEAIALLQKGTPIEEAIAKAMAPKEQPPAPAAPGETQGAAGPGGPEGFGPEGLPQGLTPGLAARGPGARPDMMTLLAGNSPSGSPVLQSGVSRMIPAG